MQQLDDRKLKILQAIIRNYLETGEPVGSRTISKYTDLNLSSATIRNEMADLEELGYIIQPHTSAGRIPTDKGYRLYVDMLLEDKIQEVETMKDILIEKADRLENLLQQVAKLLAVNTNYTTMVTTPQYKKKVKFIQLTEVDENQLLAVIVFERNIVKNKIITISASLSKETILKLNIVLNTFLQGLDLAEINLPVITQMKEQAGEYRTIVNDILDAIMQAVSEEDDIEIFTSGTTNILRYPELCDREKASKLLYTLEEKKVLTEFIQDKMEDEESRGIQVYIGDETPVESMKDCSVVTATYEIEEGIYGKVGIIGPKRMDYKKVVSTLQSLMVQLDEIFKNKT
ncbi:heat-inducible transcription repressor HrcA [Lachnospiraceae bacterium MD1]|uniref:Heat-inducible transcription repressor HrcA n=1 Tax=Variimorphobacter saccharofermentans TaxID=2755051 RepID=A0A839JZJ7_9FIRM|nr:heat-inducible transcriptional repressor HrcA [Variimorphobacter saccharofermentans]MBB2183103.1 heat-inducible transcription repressor HrcA [Variimorphobacter saccharofermentans]